MGGRWVEEFIHEGAGHTRVGASYVFFAFFAKEWHSSHNADMWPFKSSRVYLDYAAATPLRIEAARASRKNEIIHGNPGGIHAESVLAKQVLEDARSMIAHELGVKARQIIFTSGSTEGNNLGILGFAEFLSAKKNGLVGTHWIVSAIEHPSVLECFSEIERRGGAVTHLDPDAHGFVAPAVLERALRPETVLVSIGWANHEIGTVQPLRAFSQSIAKHEKEHGIQVFLHTDMGQAPLYKVPHVHSLGVDMAVCGAGKLYGPRGIGALYLSNRISITHMSLGGGQERGLRAGTEAPHLAAGFAAALSAAASERDTEVQRLAALRDALYTTIRATLPEALRNGTGDTLPHILNISLPKIQAEYVVLALDKAGIAISTRSACNANEAQSHVVAALGGEEWRAKNTLRFSLGLYTTAGDIQRVARELIRIVSR